MNSPVSTETSATRTHSFLRFTYILGKAEPTCADAAAVHRGCGHLSTRGAAARAVFDALYLSQRHHRKRAEGNAGRPCVPWRCGGGRRGYFRDAGDQSAFAVSGGRIARAYNRDGVSRRRRGGRGREVCLSALAHVARPELQFSL